jgi:uncharacterized protein (TIGR04255 family)
MFTKENLPQVIDPCPIAEAVFEVRYSSTLPIDAVFGVVYQKISKHFSGIIPQELGAMQLPLQIRRTDQNLKYQAYYSLRKNSLTLNIGPDVLTFGALRPYIGWNKWFAFIQAVLDDALVSGAVHLVERIGLRYINVFSEPILKNTTVNIQIDTNTLEVEPTNFRTEIVDSGFIKVLQIGNEIGVTENNETRKASLIDIDCLYPCNMSIEEFKSNYREIMVDAHDREKILFFNLLKPDYLDTLNPIYSEE